MSSGDELSPELVKLVDSYRQAVADGRVKGVASYNRYRAGLLEAFRIAAEMAREHGELISNEPIGRACSRNIASAIEEFVKEMGLAPDAEKARTTPKDDAG